MHSRRLGRRTWGALPLLAGAALGFYPGPALAHWCTNIYETPARLVVKPEQATIFPGDSGTLRVWVRNNFPYLVKNGELRAQNADFQVQVTPARQDILPGQDVAFDLQITRVGSSGDNDLRLQIRVFQDTGHGSSLKSWRGPTDPWVDQNPSEALVRSSMNSDQSKQLGAGKLAATYSEADGVGRLLELYGRPRLGYNSDGWWGDGDWFPPRTPDKYDFQLLRAGIELAMRRFDGFPDAAAVRQALTLAMDDPHARYRGTAALLAGYVFDNDAGVRARIQAMADSDPCVDADRCSHYSWTSSSGAQLMGRAGLLAAGDGSHESAVRAGLTNSDLGVRMVCAAALGLFGDDQAVTDSLIPLIADSFGFVELTAPYLLQLVVYDRRGPTGLDPVSFYGESTTCQSGQQRPCGTDEGECTAGTETCDPQGAWGACSGIPPGTESCNGLDDDCDGLTDEGLTPPACALQAGVCQGSTRACGGAAGFLPCDGTRYGTRYETDEVTCDGLDNDCDGLTDESLTPPACALQAGVCQGSTRTCGGAAGFLPCDASRYGPDYEPAETACDGLDNDCDGLTDEDLTGCCQEGAEQPCSTDEGECTRGVQRCDAEGVWGPCSGRMPEAEACNGLDDDCDGLTDEELQGPACELQAGVCQGSTQACGGAAGFMPCDASRYGPDHEPEETACDGLDNDCDGLTDEHPGCASPDGGEPDGGGPDGGDPDGGGTQTDEEIVLLGSCGCAAGGVPDAGLLLGLLGLLRLSGRLSSRRGPASSSRPGRAPRSACPPRR
jgi:hypothetical protein